jgi:hypothetical protein
MNNESLFSVLHLLNLPERQYAVFGGACLTARGIRDTSDLELFVTNDLYTSLKLKNWRERVTSSTNAPYVTTSIGEIAVLAFQQCGSGAWVPDVETYISEPEIINGYPFMPLEAMRSWKSVTARPKDVEDVKLIDTYLAT